MRRSYPFLTHRGDTAIVREAIGVCGLITPWNWPLYQITAKVGPALAAGCTIVLKPSELSPLSALLFAEVMHDAGVPAGVFNLVNGQGPEVGAALATHPDVDMISITGSTRAGVLVAQAAAPTVKRVAQELGGKSPNVILPDADFARAIPAAVAAGMRNVGQSCSAPTRIIVPRERLAEVERLACEAASAFVVGDPRSPQTTHGPVANRAQFNRVQEMIGVGIAEGARLVCGGPGRPQGLERGYYVRPTLFSDVQPQMRIAQEEIFGPVLVIIAYDSVDEAVEIANGTDVRPGRACAGPGPRCRARGGRAHPLRAGAHQQPALEPRCALRRLQALGQRTRIRRRRPGGIPRDQGHPRLRGWPGALPLEHHAMNTRNSRNNDHDRGPAAAPRRWRTAIDLFPQGRLRPGRPVCAPSRNRLGRAGRDERRPRQLHR